MSCSELVVKAMLGLALNRNGRVPYVVKLQAQQYITDRMHGKMTDKTVGVLVADDEEVVRRTAQSVLERAGFRVLFANNGRECVDTFTAMPNDIDLVLLDMSMPMMSGEDALGHMQKIRPDVRVILSSGFSEAEAIHQFAGKGLAGFLEKPYTSARLAESIGKLGLLHSTPV